MSIKDTPVNREKLRNLEQKEWDLLTPSQQYSRMLFRETTKDKTLLGKIKYNRNDVIARKNHVDNPKSHKEKITDDTDDEESFDEEISEDEKIKQLEKKIQELEKKIDKQETKIETLKNNDKKHRNEINDLKKRKDELDALVINQTHVINDMKTLNNNQGLEIESLKKEQINLRILQKSRGNLFFNTNFENTEIVDLKNKIEQLEEKDKKRDLELKECTHKIMDLEGDNDLLIKKIEKFVNKSNSKISKLSSLVENNNNKNVLESMRKSVQDDLKEILGDMKTKMCNEKDVSKYKAKIRNLKDEISTLKAKKVNFDEILEKLDEKISNHHSKLKKELRTDLKETSNYKSNTDEYLSQIGNLKEEISIVRKHNEVLLSGSIQKMIKEYIADMTQKMIKGMEDILNKKFPKTHSVDHNHDE